MIENYKLPRKLRRSLEKEIEASEVVHWIEQPIPRVFTRSTVGISLGLLFCSSLFAFVGFGSYEQSKNAGISLYEFPQVAGVLIPSVAVTIQLFLFFLVPVLGWLEAIQTVYVVTNKRAFILTAGFSTTVVSFIPSELRVISRRENKDGSGDVIFYIHQSKDYDGDVRTQEIGFKQVRNAKAVENILRQINAN